MMFYTTTTGWLLAYTVQYASGTMMALHTPEAVGAHFSTFTASASQTIPYLLLTTFASAGICALGVQNGVEKMAVLCERFALNRKAVLCQILPQRLPGALRL